MSLTDEQKAIRRTGITATDIGAILGLSPFKSPLDVYLTKKGEVDDAPAMIEVEDGSLRPSKDTERGEYLEPALVQWTGKRLGLPVRHTPGSTIVSPADPLVIASPDGMVSLDTIGAVLPLEVKAPGGFYRSDEWGEDGSEQVPADYEAQLRWQMAAMDADRGFLAALIGPELRVYRLNRDRDLERQMIAKAREWFTRHVTAGEPPPATTSERDQQWMKKRYPHDKLPPLRMADLTVHQQCLVRDLLSAYRESGTWKKLYEQIQVNIKEILGDHAGLTLEDGGRIDWKSNKPGEVTDWEAMARDFHRRLVMRCTFEPGTAANELVEKWETELKAFTKTVPGNRVFRPWPKKEK